MNTVLPFSEVRDHLSELADRVEQQGDHILVTRNGRPSFIMVNCDYLESLEETVNSTGGRDGSAMMAGCKSQRPTGGGVQYGTACLFGGARLD